MRSIIRRFIGVVILTAAACNADLLPQATACPMCKTANETDDPRPRAYMYSILFMLSMPAMIFTGFGVAFYRMTRNAQLQQPGEGGAEAAPTAEIPGATDPSSVETR